MFDDFLTHAAGVEGGGHGHDEGNEEESAHHGCSRFDIRICKEWQCNDESTRRWITGDIFAQNVITASSRVYSTKFPKMSECEARRLVYSDNIFEDCTTRA